jgi:hypothetical protein
MAKQSGGKIFLSDECGVMETNGRRRFSTFNFGDYFHEHKTSFSSLYVVNEEFLAGSQTLKLKIEEASCIVILPVTGQVQVSNPSGISSVVDVGEMQINIVLPIRVYNLPIPTTKEVFILYYSP